MNTLTAIAGFLAIAAMTPGPNNLVVMRAATRSGIAGTLPAIAGVVMGGLALLAVLATSAGAMFASDPRPRQIITVAGCVYLACLAMALIARRPAGDDAPARPARFASGTGFIGLFAFQFLNPKGWVMLLTAVSAAATASPSGAFLTVAAIFVPVSLLGLFSWALFGIRLTVWLTREQTRIWFDRVTGCLLLGTAALLFLEI